MPPVSTTTRRQVLSTVAAGTGVTVAGCFGGSESDDPTPDEYPDDLDEYPDADYLSAEGTEEWRRERTLEGDSEDDFDRGFTTTDERVIAGFFAAVTADDETASEEFTDIDAAYGYYDPHDLADEAYTTEAFGFAGVGFREANAYVVVLCASVGEEWYEPEFAIAEELATVTVDYWREQV